jgi:uncharacterized protein
MITKSTIKELLLAHKPILSHKYGLNTLAIFGSFAREEQTEKSDIDILVDFQKPIGIEFIDLADELELILGRKVDLVSRRGVKKDYFKFIEKELEYV